MKLLIKTLLLSVCLTLCGAVAVFANEKIEADAPAVIAVEEALTPFTQELLQLDERIDLTKHFEQIVSVTSDNETAILVEEYAILANYPGEATVTVVLENQTTQRLTLRVEGVAAESITIGKARSLELGKSMAITPIISPQNTTDRTLTWRSSKEEVVKIEGGVIQAVGVGKTTITATTKNGVKASISLKVFEIEPEEIVVEQEEMLVEIIGSEQVAATVLPEDATNQNLQYEIQDKEIATVSASGKITPKKVGKTNLTITASNGVQKTVSVEVFVVSAKEIQVKVPPEDVRVSGNVYQVTPETVLTVQAQVLPQNVSYPELTWETSDSTIAFVMNGQIEFLKKGSVTIRCTTVDGVYYDLFFEVTDATALIISVIVISLVLLIAFYWWYARLKRKRKALLAKKIAEEPNMEL